MNYKEALAYLLEHLPMFQRVGASAYRSDLTNIYRLCLMLGNPQDKLKCIHIAGTNGKGSVTHIIASILQEQGYKVGVFVSPHYKDYRERIKINGEYINRKFIAHFVEKNIDRFKTVDASFFEITTAMAFAYFKKKKVDYAIIETGMGGRLDSTNIITPILSVITNISLDHQQFLGNSVSKIAAEKAGIIKPNVPVVIGEKQKDTSSVFVKKAIETNSPIYFSRKINSAGYETDIQGTFQQKNVTTSLKAIDVLRERGVYISAKSVTNGLKHVRTNTSFIGRWMVIKRKPLLVCDSAHNEGGIRQLLTEIKKQQYNHLHFVYGTVGDKDITNVLALLPKKATYYFCKASIPRGLDAIILKDSAKVMGLKGEAFGSVKQALKHALKNASPKDMVLVSGSVFVVAEVI